MTVRVVFCDFCQRSGNFTAFVMCPLCRRIVCPACRREEPLKPGQCARRTPCPPDIQSRHR